MPLVHKTKIGMYQVCSITVLNCTSLFLNVYAPNKLSIDGSFPVKVWIHGGAFAAGGITDPLYNACDLAGDAVVVEVGYRLGGLGFLYAPDAGIDGNMGLTDMITALEWVQANIGPFGGNRVRTQHLSEPKLN
jgi:para-nitrobenzyl esterase